MNPKKKATINGLILGTILGIAVSGVLHFATHNPAVWIFAPISAVMGAAQGRLALRSE